MIKLPYRLSLPFSLRLPRQLPFGPSQPINPQTQPIITSGPGPSKIVVKLPPSSGSRLPIFSTTGSLLPGHRHTQTEFYAEELFPKSNAVVKLPSGLRPSLPPIFPTHLPVVPETAAVFVFDGEQDDDLYWDVNGLRRGPPVIVNIPPPPVFIGDNLISLEER